MKPTTIIKIKSALLVVIIHLTLAIIADLWLNINMYAPLAASGSVLYLQVLNNLKKKQQQQPQQ